MANVVKRTANYNRHLGHPKPSLLPSNPSYSAKHLSSLCEEPLGVCTMLETNYQDRQRS